MVIDINNIQTGGPRGRSGGVTGTATEKPQTAAPTTPTPADNDKVVLSAEAQNLNRLQAKISSMPDVDLERVAQIKKAIAEGKFEVNAERIAQNMLSQEDLFK
jgi:negative regulator of flagellin synthesis FlgM